MKADLFRWVGQCGARFLILSFFVFCALAFGSLQAQEESRYIEVVGTAEMEIVPDRIHYIIEIREYFAEEFDGHSKPEEYRTKVPLQQIESGLRESLSLAGIAESDIQTQEVGDYWRQEGRDFLVSKRFDVTLHNFQQIDGIIRHLDTRGINTMYIGELESDSMDVYHRQGKIAALKAAERKAAYMVEALGKKLGGVLRIVEEGGTDGYGLAKRSNVMLSEAAGFDGFRSITNTYSVLVRFEIEE
ncbi:MAG: SIMPL domain-containing protein [Bacteroidetes bacterium]|uniref:SIMPL domain-containing protein n=1 Tax=Candidatus Pullibacteroides excrementavium TaxID=2840905 RepID=A0A9D9H1G1_9BACT|nr:SIMPL domain-containing protein [Candidatus Pullibacteroides excrementavium]